MQNQAIHDQLMEIYNFDIFFVEATWLRFQSKYCLAITLNGLGANAKPGDPRSIDGNLSGSGINSNFWIIDTRKLKISIRANCSPKHRRDPTPNGMT